MQLNSLLLGKPLLLGGRVAREVALLLVRGIPVNLLHRRGIPYGGLWRGVYDVITLLESVVL